MEHAHKKQCGSKGFGIIEALIASAMTAIVILAMGEMIKNSIRAQKRVDVKSQAQDLDNRLKNILYDEVSCGASLPLSTLPTIDPDAPTDYKNDISVTLGGGRQISASGQLGDLQIDSLQLAALGEILPTGSGRYEAQLNLDPAPTFGGILPGGPLKRRSISLVLTTEPAKDSSGTVLNNSHGKPLRKISGCYSKSAVSGDQTCGALGGSWISSLNKCHWGGDLKLNQFECIDNAEFGHGGALEGGVITSCYYKSGTRMLSLACNNRTRNYVAQCVCQSGQHPSSVNGWVNKYPNYPPTSILRNCDGGVLVQLPDEKETFLASDEILDNTAVASSATVSLSDFQNNYDILETIVECFTRTDSIQSNKCKQGDERAVAGMAGSCIFVNNSSARGTAAGERSLSPYTGWIYVTRKRSMTATGTGASRSMGVAEASGRKCYQVKRIIEDTPPDLVRLKYNEKLLSGVDVLADAENKWQNIKECLFLGGTGTDDEPTPSATPVSHTTTYLGEYLQRFSCDQEDIDVNNLTGDAAYAVPTLKKGNCWYFNDVVLRPDYADNTHVNYTGGKARYTGWVYLSANIRDSRFDTLHTSSHVNEVALQSLSNEILVGIPCNAGVRIAQ